MRIYLLFTYLFILIMFMSVYAYMCAGARGDQKRVLELLNLKWIQILYLHQIYSILLTLLLTTNASLRPLGQECDQ